MKKISTILMGIVCGLLVSFCCSCVFDSENPITPNYHPVHHFSEWESDKEFTCTSGGTQHRTCFCGEKQTRTVEPQGHSWTASSQDDLMVCSVCGATTGSADSDASTDNSTDINGGTTDSKPNEGGTVDSKPNDSGTTDSKPSGGTTESNPDQIPDADEHVHVYGNWITTKAPTCTASGIRQKGCSICNNVVSEEIDATGHTEEIVAAKEPTCTKEGLTEGKKCSTCEKIIVQQTAIPAKGHDYVSGICSICEEAKPKSQGLELTLYNSGKDYTVSGIGTCTDLEIVIPSSYNGIPVTSISKHAFYGCDTVASITIPSSVTRVGEEAFAFCDSLTIYCEALYESHYWDDSWNYSKCPVVWDCTYKDYATDGNIYAVVDGIRYAIRDGVATIVTQPINLKDFTLRESITYNKTSYPVTSIAKDAFNDFASLTTLVLPNSITSIGDSAFSLCKNLASITLPSDITNIGDYLFSGCTNLTAVSIPAGITSIGDGAFGSCYGLTSIEIPSSVTSIGDEVFRFCYGLTSIEIPSSVTSIGDSAFESCNALTSITVDQSNPNYKSSGGILYTKDGTTLIKYAAGKADTSFEIPSGVTVICDYAFSGSTNLTSVVIPNSVTSIGNSAFYNCASLTSITFEEGDLSASIGNYAFYKCTNLTSIVIPNNVTSIGNNAFSECTSLTIVIISNGVTTMGSYVFLECSATIYCEAEAVPSTWNTSWNKRSYSGSDGSAAFGYSYVIVDGIVYGIKDGFAAIVDQPRNIEGDIIILDSIDYNGESYPVTSICYHAFYFCAKLTSVVIPSGVTSIDKYAFYKCDNLTSVVIPSSVTSIDEYAFHRCDNLTIYCESECQPEEWNTDWNYSKYPVEWGYKQKN